MKHPVVQVEFAGVPVRVINIDGELYIPGEDIGRMLGYEEPGTAIRKIFNRRRDELELHSLPYQIGTGAGKREARIYTETGAYLIAMFARTARAKDVRRWLARLPKHLREKQRCRAELERLDYEEHIKQCIPLPEPGPSERDVFENISHIARCISKLNSYRLPPEIMDRLFLYYILDAGVVHTTLVTGVPSEVVREIFRLFVELGYPIHKEYSPLPWDPEREPYLQQKRISVEAGIILYRILSLVDHVRFHAGQYLDREAFFSALEGVAPDWLEVENNDVVILEQAFGVVDGAVISNIAREIQWVWHRDSGLFTLKLPQHAFYQRYVQRRAWP